MENRYLFRGKRIDNGEWMEGDLVHSVYKINDVCVGQYGNEVGMVEVEPSTICQCTGLKDKNGNLIWENDILMCHGKPEDLVKAIFGEFNVINVVTLDVIERVIGWHYEVLQTDVLSKCKPFCLPMPLTEEYIKRCEMEVVYSPELLE